MLSKADAEAKAMTIIAASHFSCSIVLLSIGIQVFMCFYGLSTFLETPREMRKGRLPYITFSFIILFTSGITTAFTLYFYVFYFENLYTSGPNIDYIIVNQELANGRMWTVDKACTATDTLLGHGLLVSPLFMPPPPFLAVYFDRN
ncbi:hypothetical protein CC1G_15375 [Coprinopsis cinerea okayama7|uniref:Uncharacterized protein n=1 Tax=Coprinopsis cinerea (strain Okayama-7 / 130 / ATCC MYA-4618 / FGSC 9003) TaxID=240176 RepID=D6RQK6_COPC7|nr:hypothetical protein CC1G_15375 [Coprinopsis cinerea okayama7\|eukprot:XP_002910097.1 hypothetical protein CC1G_15375 [Coprinopsis cinerea okayama7\